MLTWLMRGLMGLGGACLVFTALPVARAAWEAQKADDILYDLRLGRSLDLAKVRAGIVHLDRAVMINPTAGRYFVRSELLGGAGLTYSLKVSDAERTSWQRRAQRDLEKALGDDPVRGIDWLRLAAMRQILDGPSREVLGPLFLSIDYAALIPQIWPSRLRLILDNWPYYSDEQKDRLTAYMTQTWFAAPEQDRRFMVWAIHGAADELILRYFLRDIDGAQAEIGRLIRTFPRP
jgi:hypothetical protein